MRGVLKCNCKPMQEANVRMRTISLDAQENKNPISVLQENGHTRNNLDADLPCTTREGVYGMPYRHRAHNNAMI